MWVVLYHVANHTPVLRYGYLGVDVFFILSGFILSYVYAPQQIRWSATAYVNFLWIRLARIYPLHFFALLLVLLATLTLPGFIPWFPLPEQRFGVGPFIASLFLVQNWAHWLPTSWNSPAWSLSAEWFAYLIFPLLLVACRRVRAPAVAVALAAGCLAALAAVLMVKGAPTLNVTGTPGMVRMLCEFTAGCLLYRVYETSAGLPVALVTGAAAGLLAISVADDRLTLLAPFAFALIVLLGAQRQGPVSHVLATRPIMILGEISFSLYMLHWIIIQVSNWAVPLIGVPPELEPWWNIGLVAIVLLAAFASYHGIERPARSLGRRISFPPAPRTPEIPRENRDGRFPTTSRRRSS